MRWEDLLNVLAIFEREQLDYQLTGGLARMLLGTGALSERIEIAVSPTDVHAVHAMLRSIWPETDVGTPASSPAERAASRRHARRTGSETLPAQPAGRQRSTDNAITRYFPPNSPMFVDLLTSSATDDAPEQLFIAGVTIRVGTGEHDDDASDWTRPGFTMCERINNLNAFACDVLPLRSPLRGVRKYRSAEALFFDRDETTARRVAELRHTSAPS